MRLGWDDDNLTAPDLARVLEEAGVAAVFVHGRTRRRVLAARLTSPASVRSCKRSGRFP